MAGEWKDKFRQNHAGRCKHFTGVGKDDVCKAGINYEELAGGRDGMIRRLPCCIGGSFFGSDGAKPCALRIFPTPKEVEAEIAEMEQGISNTITARAAITDMLKANGKPTRNVSGRMPCPICNKGTLGFSIAYNGHCHGHCNTQGCVNWME